MEVTQINIAAEVRRFLRGRKTKATPEMLLHLIGDEYLELLKDCTEAGEVDALFLLHRLEDPRGLAVE
jgi:hypothetical protein